MFFMMKISMALIVFSSLVLSVGCKGETELGNQELKATTESTPTTEIVTELPNPFSDGVKAATEASQLAQTAKTYQEWEKVSQLWQQAVEKMQAVPSSDSNYNLAQQKVGEYQSNKIYVQKIIDLQEMHLVMADAVYNNDVQKVRELLTQGFDPNHRDIDEDRTPGHPSGYVLFTGAFSGRDQSVQELIKAGASWKYLDQDNTLDLLLLSASCNGQPFTVSELIKAGADPNFSDQNENPLALASSPTCRTINNSGNPWRSGEADHDRVVQVLREAGAR